MSPDAAAILTLTLYASVAAGLVWWQFRKSKMTPQAWILWVGERVYVGILYQWRANRRCPFPDRDPAIIIANHRGPVAPLLIWMINHLGAHKRPARIIGFMTASEYCTTPGIAWICTAMHSIPVERQ